MEGWGGVALMVLLGAVVGLGGLVISNLLGPKNPTPEKLAAYECGMPPVGDARERQSVKFYLIAMIFLLFDIEVAFLYPWAMAMRELWLARAHSDHRVLPDPAGRLRLHLAQGRPRLGARVGSRLQASRRGPVRPSIKRYRYGTRN